MSSSTVWISTTLLLSASALSGCVVDSEPGDGSDVEVVEADGDWGEVEEAFGEATCGTTAYANVENSTNWTIASTSPYYSATNGNYGQPDCSHAFIVDYNNGTNKNVNVWAGFHTQPTTSGACSLAHVKVHTYHWVNGAWVFHEEMKRHGAWRGGECWFDVDSGSSQASIGTVPTRVVAQAYSTFCLPPYGCSTTYQGVKINAYESM